MRNISIYYLIVLLILVVGCSNQDNIVIIEGSNIKNKELVDVFYSNIKNNESSTLVIENRNGKEGQKSISTYKFNGIDISYEVVEPEKNKGFVIKCEDIEKENENNSIIYKLIECSNTGLGKETISIIKIPK